MPPGVFPWTKVLWAGPADSTPSFPSSRRAASCLQCRGSGFRGRVGIFELFEITDQMRARIMERQDGGSIRAAAAAAGMRTMFGDGLAKVFLGETTLAEVFRVAL